jgi:transmembrane sensor
MADYATRVGERRRIGLADGSAVDLNTSSALSVAFTDRVRRLELHAGEAMFEVASDASRPFVVDAAGTETQAIGTVFSVRRDDAVSVRVVEGEVAVGDAGTKGTGVRVAAGQQVAFAADGSRSSPEPFDVAAETAWRRGKLIFNRRPLGEVASELDRYRVGRIAIPDARLRRLEVTGVFDLSDPDAVLRTIGQTLPVTVVQLPYVALIY